MQILFSVHSEIHNLVDLNMVANPKTLYVSCKFTLVDFKKSWFCANIEVVFIDIDLCKIDFSTMTWL